MKIYNDTPDFIKKEFEMKDCVKIWSSEYYRKQSLEFTGADTNFL